METPGETRHSDTPMAERIAAFDWAATPLGPRSAWDPALISTLVTALDAPFPMVVLWGPDHIVAGYNDAYVPLLGDRPCALGAPMLEVWAEAAGVIGEELDAALAGRAVRRDRTRFVLDRQGASSEAWFDYAFSPIRTAGGAPGGVLNIAQEITREIAAEAARDLLNLELSHRVKNTLAVVNSLAGLSFRGADAAPQAVKRFRNRLQALSAAQDLLFEGEGARADLRTLAERALGPCMEESQVRIEGPDVRVGSGVAGKLALILHELCTNAVKHGALAGGDGRARLDWRIGEDGGGRSIHLTWREEDGPSAEHAGEHGFGTQLIRLALSTVPGARTTLEFTSDGVICDITVPAA